MYESWMRTILLTGATGALGSAVVPELLRQPDDCVVLLMRPGQQGLNARMENLKHFWRGYGVADRDFSRVEALAGDVALERMGLAEADYRALAGRLTHIVHAAANVKINMPEDEARRSSVATTQSALRLARDCPRLEKLEYISTVGVAGARAGRILEERMTGERGFHNTYESSKAEAEELVFAAMEAGLPVTIHRPSMVLGNSQDGKTINFQVFYHLAEFLSGRATGGWVPRLPGFRLDTVPNDYVAKALALSLRHPEWKGKIFHLSASREGSWPLESYVAALPGLMREGGMKVPATKRMPWKLFAALVPLAAWFAPANQRKAFRNLPRFLSYLGEPSYFDNTNARRYLEPEGVVLPPLEDYLPRVMRYYAAAKTVPR